MAVLLRMALLRMNRPTALPHTAHRYSGGAAALFLKRKVHVKCSGAEDDNSSPPVPAR